MEKEKREKKEKILKITKEVEQVAKDSWNELEEQGNQLKGSHKVVKKIGDHISSINKDLDQIEHHRKGKFCTCLSNFFCCTCCALKSNKNQLKIEIDQSKNLKIDEHLTPERIEKEWCQRYDPEDNWMMQVEVGLDYLLKLAEQMKKSFDEQNELAERIYLDAKTNQERMKKSRKKMANIQHDLK